MRFHKKDLSLVIILLVCISGLNSLWSQNQLPPKLQDYITTMEQLAKETSVDSFKIVINEMPTTKFKRLLRKMYEAYDEDVSGLGVYQDTKSRAFNQEYKEWLKNKSGKDPRSSGFVLLQNYMLDRVIKDISATVAGELKVAYFLRIHTIAIKHSKQQKENLKGSMTLIDAEVEKVYKGNPKFKIHDTLEFYFYNSWLGVGGPMYWWFKEGKDYFVPLEPRYSPEEGDLIALAGC